MTDYKFGIPASNNLAAVYKQPPPSGCKLAVCARFPTQVGPHWVSPQDVSKCADVTSKVFVRSVGLLA